MNAVNAKIDKKFESFMTKKTRNIKNDVNDEKTEIEYENL